MHRSDTKRVQKFSSEIVKGRDHSEDLGINRKTILEWVLRK